MVPSEFSPAFDGILGQLADNGMILDMTPLRLILFTPDLSDGVSSPSHQKYPFFSTITVTDLRILGTPLELA